MEVEGSQDRKLTVMIYEALGTALFIYGVIMTDNAASIPFSLFAAILIFGGVTGGHFNPAVSLGVYIAEGKEYGENFLYLVMIWAGQFLGGFLAMGLAYLSLYEAGPRKTTVAAELVPRLCPQQYPVIDNVPDCDNWDGESGFMFEWEVFVNEIVCTFVFVSVILMVKLKEDHIKITHDGISGAIAVCLTLLAVVTAGGKLGACYNPAVAVTLSVNSMTFLDNPYGYLNHYAPFYFVGPLVGAALAGFFHLFHKNVLLEEAEDSEQEAGHRKGFANEVKQSLVSGDDQESRSDNSDNRINKSKGFM